MMGPDTFPQNAVGTIIGSCNISLFMALPVIPELIKDGKVAFENTKLVFCKDSSDVSLGYQLLISKLETVIALEIASLRSG